jgi:hypothetical protein
VDPVPDPLLLRKSGSAGNRTRTSGSVARNSDVNLPFSNAQRSRNHCPSDPEVTSDNTACRCSRPYLQHCTAIARGLDDREIAVRFPTGQNMSFSTASRPTVTPIEPSLQWTAKTFRQRRDASALYPPAQQTLELMSYLLCVCVVSLSGTSQHQHHVLLTVFMCGHPEWHQPAPQPAPAPCPTYCVYLWSA